MSISLSLSSLQAQETKIGPLEILALCKNRYVSFDNKTRDERKRLKQVEQLLSLVDKVVAQNGGKPYMDELFTELKEGAIKLHNQQMEVDAMKGYWKREIMEMKELMHRTYDEQLKRIAGMVETNLREATTRLEKQLAEEHATRLKAEENAFLAQKKSEDEIRILREKLEMTQRKLRKKDEGCAIL